jgi:cytidylate kinase
MPIITISRQFGAAGRPIGERIAERFGAELLDREIVSVVAERAGIPEQEAEGYDEQLPGLWQRIAAALAAGSPDPAIPPLPVELMPATAVHERLARLTRAVIEEAADRGNCVILGRGGAFIVGRRPNAVHVQLHAALEARVRYLGMRFEEIPADTRPDEASLLELCRTMDSRRSNYIRRLFGVDWQNPNNYDLSVDTGRVDLTTAADVIELVARRRIAVPPENGLAVEPPAADATRIASNDEQGSQGSTANLPGPP